MTVVSLLVAMSLPWSFGFDHGPVKARFLVDKVNRDRITSEYVYLFVSLSGSFHQSTKLNLIILSRLLDEGMGENWERSKDLSDVGENYKEITFILFLFMLRGLW